MYLDPRGRVQACCRNVMFPLGKVGTQTIGQIWSGDRRAALALAINDGDFSKGCDRCSPDANTDQGRNAYARVFDDIPLRNSDVDALTNGPSGASNPGRQQHDGGPRQLELALSNRCNLQCVMCNGELSSAIRAQRDHLPPISAAYDDAFFDQLEAWLPGIFRLVLLGGEPFLAPETTRVFDLIESTGSHPRVHVTTNGTVWNRIVDRAVERGTLDVSVSIDALDPTLFESIRVGADHATVFENLERFRERAEGNDSTVGVSFTLMDINVEEFAPMLVWCAERSLSVHVNVCDYPPAFSIFRQTPERFAEIAAVLKAVDLTDEQFGLNASAWHAVLAQVDAHEQEPGRSALADAYRFLAERARRPAGTDGQVAPIVLTTDAEMTIRSVTPTDAAFGDLSLAALVGSPIHAFRDRLVALGGSSFSASVEQLESGVEVQHLHFGPNASPRGLTAAVVPSSQENSGGLTILVTELIDDASGS